MSAVRRMKYEMTLKERALGRARRACSKDFDALLDSLTPNDRTEMERFKALLGDLGKMPLPELIQRHGAAYLGFTAEEVDAIEARANEVQP
jgi:hypothetical protein